MPTTITAKRDLKNLRILLKDFFRLGHPISTAVELPIILAVEDVIRGDHCISTVNAVNLSPSSFVVNPFNLADIRAIIVNVLAQPLRHWSRTIFNDDSAVWFCPTATN